MNTPGELSIHFPMLRIDSEKIRWDKIPEADELAE